MLKKIMMGTALAALVASSAMAQSYQPEWGSGNIVPNTNQSPNGSVRSETLNAYAFVPAPDAYAFVPAPHRSLYHHRAMQGHSDMDRF
jgi:hypothetical protein